MLRDVLRSEFVKTVKERLDAEAIEMPYPDRQLSGGISIDGEMENQPTQATTDD